MDGITDSIKMIKRKKVLYHIYQYLKGTLYNIMVVITGRAEDLERYLESLSYYFQHINFEFQIQTLNIILKHK